MTMEGLINTFWETFYPITDAESVFQHALRPFSQGKRISHRYMAVTRGGAGEGRGGPLNNLVNTYYSHNYLVEQ